MRMNLRALTASPVSIILAIPAVTACVLGLLAAVPAQAVEQWAGESFLADYSTLQPMPGGKEGHDYAYIAPEVEKFAGRYVKVMLDQPEVFISADSPYRGAQPEDLAVIAGAVRNACARELEQRGYAIVHEAAPDTVYVRLAVTNMQIAKKKRGLLAYTPVGFVVNAGVKAVQGFMEKYDLLDMALQAEVRDSVSQEVLAAAVLQRGKSAEARKPISFDTLEAVTSEFGGRFACRLDNSRVPAGQRIDCSDPDARKARPPVVGQ